MMLWTDHVDAAVRTGLHLTHVSVAEVDTAFYTTVTCDWRRGADGTRFVRTGQVAVRGVRIVDVVERCSAVTHVDVDAVDDM